jgi:hypothetical protein
MFESFYRGLKDIAVAIINFIWSIFFDENNGVVWWLIDTFFSYGEWFLLQLVNILGMENLLSRYSGVIIEVMTLCSKLDAFLPLHESVELFGIFLSFLVIFLSVKLILKLIPGIG